MKRRSSSEAVGSALISALLALLMVSVALAIAAGGLLTDFYALRLEVSTVELSALSDAALADALAHLHEDEGFPGFSRYEFSDGFLESIVERDSAGRYRLRVGAYRRGQGRCVEVRAARTEEDLTVLSWSRLYDGSSSRAASCVSSMSSP